ncbi:MAG: alanine racemase [Deltaproteobacteria bacterium]|nr:alanine racemase [Deltaproteobacteria bacterium]
MTVSGELPNEITMLLLRPTWVEVDLDAIEHNVKTVKKWLGDVKLIGVLKGDACGFGTEECGAAMEAAGANMLAVANPFEVKVLRRRGIKCPILLFASYLPESAPEIVTLGAIPTIVDFESAQALADAAKKLLSEPLDIFIKLDTGLGRLGVPFEQGVSLVKFVSENPYLRLIGLYSHAGDSPDERAKVQYQRFQSVLSELYALGVDVPIRVIASTPHVLRHPHMWMNAVDPGRLLFGIKQPPDAPVPEGHIRSALRGLRTKIIQVKNVTAGDPPQYSHGRTNKTPRYGVLPFGWADVFLPSVYENSGALVRGVKVRFLKSFSAEHSVIDLTEVPDARVGDTVTIIGEDGESFIDEAQLAREAEILVSELTRRFHRHLCYIYFRQDKPVKVKTVMGNTMAGE